MASATETSTAIFDCCPDSSFVSTSTPRFYRTDWDGVELPRQPSLKLIDDEFFFQLISSNHPEANGKKRRRFFDFVPRPTNPSQANQNLVEHEDVDVMSAKNHPHVPLHIRKLEIELVQRKLPRYPSQTHRSEASFYPLASSDQFDTQEQSLHSNSSLVRDDDDDNDSTTEVEIIFIEEDEDEILFENYDSEVEEETETEEVDPDNMNEEGLNKMQIIHSQNIEYTDQEECQRRLEIERQHQQTLCSSINIDDKIDDGIHDNIDETIDESSTSDNTESSCSSATPPPPIIPEEEPYEYKIGVIPPSLQSMIFQAQMEMRCRKVPEEHKNKFKPSVSEASIVGCATRLNEHTVEAYGRQCEKYKPLELPSATWVKGEESVSLPTFADPIPAQFTIFNEATALGGIKALKPEITTNYDRLASNNSSHHGDVDIDDTNKHKCIRTKYLTDLYLHDDFRERPNDEEDELERTHYESLDDVKLPTSQCPVRKPVTTKMTNLELKDAIAQQVAEKVWERRYRLERPRAEQRIKSHCDCRHCKTSSPYQTFAYRKRWLVQQDLWKEPPVEEDLELMSMGEKEVDRGDVNVDLEKDDEMSGDMTMTTDIVAVTTSSSDPASVFEVEESEMTTKNNMSIILEKDEDRIDSNLSIVETNGISSPPGSHSVPPRQTSKDKRKPKVKQKKTFMLEVQSVLGLSQHSTGSSTQRLQKENGRKKRSEQRQKVRNKRKGMIRSGMNSMRSLFGNSSHHGNTKTD